MSIDQRLAVWRWNRRILSSGETADSEPSAFDNHKVVETTCRRLLPEVDGSVAVVLQSVHCSSVADIQNMASYTTDDNQQQFVICVGIGLEIFHLNI